MNFLAIDVETANADYSSLCQIGVAEFKGGEVVDKWSTLINPKVEFNPFNTSIHGIGEIDVVDAPTFEDVYHDILERIGNRITIHHGHFDRVAVNRACTKCALDSIEAIWLDSAKVARRTWDQFAYKGYGLSNIARHLEIKFKHHDALEDAVTAGKIVSEACRIRGLSIDDWLVHVETPINGKNKINKKLKANSDGHLNGEVIVFTGALKSISRQAAKEIASQAGCQIKNNVSKKVTMLILGVQDPSKLAGYKRSTKHRKAEKLIKEGHDLKILSEDDFIEICNQQMV